MFAKAGGLVRPVALSWPITPIASQGSLQQQDLTGMIQVVLCDADELRVRGVGGLGYERLIQAFWSKRSDSLPELLIESGEVLRCLPPVRLGG
jgi:hypothetical protein